MSPIYADTGRLFQELGSIPIDEEGLYDIEKRVKMQPLFLGEPLVVFASARDFSHIVEADTPMLFALDVRGRVVVIALGFGAKDTGDTVAMQAAAHCSLLSAEELGKIARAFIERQENDSLRQLWLDQGVEMNEESLELASLLASSFERDTEDYTGIINQEQRLIFTAEGYSNQALSMMSWLLKAGVDLRALRYRKYMVGGQEIFYAEQLLPRVDPAEDAGRFQNERQETAEPWRTKGRQYHYERLSPGAGNLLNNLLFHLNDVTFSVNWNNRHYFWIRGSRRNLRIRTYHRDRLEIGFHNAGIEQVEDMLADYGIDNCEVQIISGYHDSPFVTLNGEAPFTEAWKMLLYSWLAGNRK